VDQPNLNSVHAVQTNNFSEDNQRFWKTYKCLRCGGLVIASSKEERGEVTELYPAPIIFDEAIPQRARTFLEQAVNSLHAPAGSVMLSASAVDAMLKAKGYSSGSLYSRIDQAKKDNLITEEMGRWAHAVRLDANEQRHADLARELPTSSEAQRSIDFVLALGHLLFVLPQRVARGMKEAEGRLEEL
jgi:Domain of unknown function (DUF4145)